MKNEVKLAWICGIFGLMFCLLGVRDTIKYSRYVSINADITKVKEQYVRDEDDYRYRVEYQYQVGNTLYTGYFQTNENYKNRQGLVVYYDPEYPAAVTRNAHTGPDVFLLFGAGTVIASIVYGFRYSE